MLTTGLRRRRVLVAAVAALALGPELLGPRGAVVATGRSGAPRYQVLAFSRTGGFRHDSIPDAIAAGNGFVGVHSTADTEYDWSWYGGLVGAYFASHPDIQTATLQREDASHPSTASLPEQWVRTDEWYNFRTDPRDAADVHVLISLDESTYSGGTMGDHPIAWYHSYAGGRAWYTAGGHTQGS